jgi:Ran GTPase-activating protein (RanGAP) involved in mRNA processing and transport
MIPEYLLRKIELIKSNKLKSIDCADAGFGDEGAEELAEALKANTSVSVLELYGCRITDKGAKAVAEALKVNKSIEVVDLGENDIGDEGACAIAQALKDNKKLKSIGLGKNQIKEEGAKAVADALKVNEHLIDVCLFGNRIGAEGAEAVAEALRDNTCVKRLALDGCYITDKVAEALKYNKSIVSLYFREPNGASGAKVLAKVLEVNTTLEDVFFGGNQIGDEGAKAVAEALKVNKHLKKVNFGCNQIGDEGAKAVAEALKVNTTLEKVFLWGNRIRDEGAKAVAEALKVNTTLQDMILRTLLEHAEVLSEIKQETDINHWLSQFPLKALDSVEFKILKDILSEMIVRYPVLLTEPQLAPKKIVDLFDTIDSKLYDVAHKIFYSDFPTQEARFEALRNIISLLEHQLKPDERHLLIEMCIQELRGEKVDFLGLKLLSYRLLLEASRKIQPSLSLDSKYHPETAGKLIANPEVMECFGMKPVTNAKNSQAFVLIDTVVTNQPIVFMTQTKPAENSASDLGLFSHQEESSGSLDETKPKTGI